MSKLIIDLNDEYKVRIETAKEFDQSIFRYIYINAAKNVCEMINQSENKPSHDAYNNIIAFTGERGKGKSSCMISFKNALIGHQNPEHTPFFNRLDLSSIRDKKFASIDIIDPSLFRGSETLFEIIIAKLFSHFQKKIESTDSFISHEDKRLIISDFQKVFNNLKVISGDKEALYEKESIEALSELAYGSNLNESFKKLITNYLKKVLNADYLVIAIDDFDLNISGAFEMLEDIRQFLIQKNIIILIACKIEQLKESITNELLKEYGALVNYDHISKNGRPNTIITDSRFTASSISFKSKERDVDQYKKKAEKYLEKLFPHSHQLPMPLMNSFTTIEIEVDLGGGAGHRINNNEVIIYIDKTKKSASAIGEILSNESLTQKLLIEKKLFKGLNLQDILLELIYSQTKIFISKPKFRINAIIPETLRQIHNLVGAISINDDPLEGFKNYIVDQAQNELPEKFADVFRRLEIQDFGTLNLYLLNLLGELKEDFDISNKYTWTAQLLYPKNPGLASVGDVFSTIRKFYENVRLVESDSVRFLDYVSIYYAIRVKKIALSDNYLLRENLKGGYFNSFNDVFPIQRIGNKRRDWVEFNRSVIDDITVETKFWIGFFIPYFGALPQEFRSRNESPFFREINAPGAPITRATFSPLTPLSHVLFPEEIWQSLFGRQIDMENQLYHDVVEWNKENKFQSYLDNIMFYSEFVDILDKLSKKQHKAESLKTYYTTIFDYMIYATVEALKIMKEKYSYLDQDLDELIRRHPIYQYWVNNDLDEELERVIDAIFESATQPSSVYSQDDISKAASLYNQYLQYFRQRPIRSSQGTKQAMNSIVKAFSNNPSIHNRLREIRAIMNNNLEIGLEEMEFFLKSII